jgi:hypothetical protein
MKKNCLGIKGLVQCPKTFNSFLSNWGWYFLQFKNFIENIYVELNKVKLILFCLFFQIAKWTRQEMKFFLRRRQEDKSDEERGWEKKSKR